MWAVAGPHGNWWTYANIVLSNPTPFRVTFQGEVGGDVWTDIALDDISFTQECIVGGKVPLFSLNFHFFPVSPVCQHPHITLFLCSAM